MTVSSARNSQKECGKHAIKTFKKHVKAGLETTNDLFLMHLWCRLLPQACTTIKLM